MDSEASLSFYHGGIFFLNPIQFLGLSFDGVVCSSYRWSFSDSHCIKLKFGLLLPSGRVAEKFGTERVK